MQSRDQDKPVVGYFIPVAPTPVADAFDWSVLMRKLWRSKWLIAICAIVFGIGFGVLATFTKKTYRAEALVSIVEQEGGAAAAGLSGQLGRLASIAGVNIGGGTGNRQELFAYLTSRQLYATFIEREQLMPMLFPDRWDSAASAWRTGDGAKAPSMDEAVERLRRSVLKIALDRESGLIKVAAENADGATAARLANSIIAVGNTQVRTRVAAEASSSLAFLTKELSNTPDLETRQAIYEIMQRQLNSRMLTSVREEYAYKVVDPAFVPDARRFVRPRRVVYVAIGLFLGFLIGSSIAIYRRET